MGREFREIFCKNRFRATFFGVFGGSGTEVKKQPGNLRKRDDFGPPGPSRTSKRLESECEIQKITKLAPRAILRSIWGPFWEGLGTTLGT